MLGGRIFAASKKRIRVSRSGRFSYSSRAEPGLRGTIGFASVAKLELSAKRRITLGTLPFTVPASGVVTVRVKLSRKDRRVLSRKGRIRFRATVALRSAAGASGSGTTTLARLAPRRR